MRNDEIIRFDMLEALSNGQSSQRGSRIRIDREAVDSIIHTFNLGHSLCVVLGSGSPVPVRLYPDHLGNGSRALRYFVAKVNDVRLSRYSIDFSADANDS